jgi:hypothetical protein
MTRKTTVGSEEPTKLIDSSDPTGDYDVVVEDAAVILNDRLADARDREGRRLERGRPAEITKNKPDEEVFAIAATSANANVAIEKTRFRIVRQPPIRDVSVVRQRSSTGDSFDTAGADSYPIDIDPVGGVAAVLLTVVEGEVTVSINTTGGDTVDLPVNAKAVIDNFEVESVTIKDGGTTPRVAGGWASE